MRNALMATRRNPPTASKTRPVRTIRSESGTAYKISRTLPDEIVRHDISDEELTLLADARIDYQWEGMWVALGISLGAAPTAVPAILRASDSNGGLTVSGGDLVQIVIFSCAIVATVILWWIMKGKRKNVRDLVNSIRKRTRREVPANTRHARPRPYPRVAAHRPIASDRKP